MFSSFSANAAGKLEVKHWVISSENSGSYQSIHIKLEINNLGDKDLHNVKLSPSDSIFSVSQQDSQINVGNLPAMGQSIVDWSFDTPAAEGYFSSGMPLFFILKAKQDNGDKIEFPVYSNGGVTQ